MAFADTLTTRTPRTAAEHYEQWLANLPDTERNIVTDALTDGRLTHQELKKILESDEDNPSPRYGMTAFREWRASK